VGKGTYGDSRLEVEQLGNPDWPWSPGESLQRVALFIDSKRKREVQLWRGNEENVRKQGKPA